MNRRELVLGSFVLGTTGLPMGGIAQVRRSVGPLRIALLPDASPRPTGVGLLQVLIDTLRDNGRAEGRDFVLLRSGIMDGQDVELAIQRAVDESPDLIFAGNTGYAVAAQRLTRSIPIVMWVTGFPVEAGVADSLARPGRNVTGGAGFAGTGVFGKHIQLLREVKPGIKRIGVLWSYVPPFYPRESIEPCYAEIREAARRLELDVRILEIAKPEQIDAALATVTAERFEALVLTTGAGLAANGQKIMNFVSQKRLPTLTDYRWTWVDPQPLLSYGAPLAVLMRQAATYVDRILWGGVKPGDLPIQLPAKFEFVINLKTARALGLTIPQALLLRADEVVE